MTDQESLELFAAIGLLLMAWMVMAYFMGLGYLAGRPSKIEAAILLRALQANKPSPDNLMADKEAKIAKALEKRSKGWF